MSPTQQFKIHGYTEMRVQLGTLAFYHMLHITPMLSVLTLQFGNHGVLELKVLAYKGVSSQPTSISP